MRVLALGVALLGPLAPACALDRVQDGTNVVYRVDGSYEDARAALEESIVNTGFVVSGVLHAATMFGRTGADLGFPDPVFAKAESLEFCSALLSHLMVRSDPSNVSVCPFTIAVYVTIAEPDRVYVAFRRQSLAGNSAAIEDEAYKLLDGIVRAAFD